MANHFTKASFTLAVTPAEAEVLRLIEDAIEALDDAPLETDARAARFSALGPAFSKSSPIPTIPALVSPCRSILPAPAIRSACGFTASRSTSRPPRR